MKISIITAVLNNKKHIEGCIESVINQTCKDIEHIIVDGGSADGTVQKIQSSKLKIKNCIVISEKDSGIYDAINKGINNSTGDIIGLLHSDDVFADKTVIEKVVGKFIKEKTESVYGDLE